MNKPNYILTQAFAYKKFDEAPYIKTPEVALYYALFRIWNSSYYKPIIAPYKKQLMKVSKIGNKNTIDKALLNLELAGVLSIQDKIKSNLPFPIKMIGVYSDNDIAHDSKLTEGRDKSDPRVRAKVTQHIKQENNSKKEEKKRKSFFN